MSCSICLEDIIDNPIKADCGICNLEYHPACYNEFKTKLNFNCPICRIKKKNIQYENFLIIFNFIFTKIEYIILPIINLHTNYSYQWFINNPNTLTFILLLFSSIFFTTIIILPMIIFLFITITSIFLSNIIFIIIKNFYTLLLILYEYPIINLFID